jgi:hypothetical protein
MNTCPVPAFRVSPGSGRPRHPEHPERTQEMQVSYYDDDPWADLRAAERADAQVELDVLKAQSEKLERQIKALQSARDPEGAKVAQLAADLGRPVDDVKADLSAIRATSQAPKPPDYAKLDKALQSVDPHDYEGAVRALDAAGYVTVDSVGQSWKHGRIQRSGEPKGSTEEIYAFLDASVNFEDYQARLRQVGLLDEAAQ